MELNELIKRIIAFTLIVFTLFFAYDVYSGKLFATGADGKMNILAVFSAWMIDCIGRLKTIFVILITGCMLAFFITKKEIRTGP